MIVQINILLGKWGAYASRLIDGGIGYPKQSAFSRMTPPDLTYGNRFSDTAQDILDIDVAIQRMPSEDIQLVVQKYVKNKKDVDHCKEIGCHKATFFRRIDRIHYFLSRELEAIYAERMGL